MKILLIQFLSYLILFNILSFHKAYSQIDLNAIKDQVNNMTGSSSKSLTNDEIISGLKEALTVGSNNSSKAASKMDGFYKNPSIKIPFPNEAKEMEQTLRNIGMSRQVNDFILTLNRAAEHASKEATPIFTSAIKKMTITDGVQILKGNDDAATVYLKKNTYKELTAKFKPIIKKSIQQVEVTKYWNPLASKYNKLPFVKKVNPNLEDYVTQKALDGLFILLAQEELKIRKDPVARISDILKKVFGFLG